jgi:predicted NBD/HSP70 family sugar kinase
VLAGIGRAGALIVRVGAHEHGPSGVPGVGSGRPAGIALLLVPPRVAAPLDPGFRPTVLARQRAESFLRTSAGCEPATIAVEQPGGSIAVRRTWTLADGHPDAALSYWFAERLLKSLLWSRGGCRILVAGPSGLVDALRHHYADDPAGVFDARVMGDDIYGSPFEIVHVSRDEIPAPHNSTTALGRHLEGCRIGFDLGASDRKAAAVIDGQVVFSEEVAWDPRQHDDPQWHVDQIMASLHSAASHLPQVDAIGGSVAGVYVDGEVRVSSLFRAVPRDLFEGRVRGLFGELRHAWGDVPFVVVNDGEVTALAGAMMSAVGSLLGIAMGSSEAAGYVTADGRITGWLNELAFVPVDYAPDAPTDEWSGDRGCGAQYLSQQAAARLLDRAGVVIDPGSSLPERLVRLQELLAAGDRRAADVYDTIGTYLGYALLEYRDLYEFEHVLLLGRVLTGEGGEVIREQARTVLVAEDPSLAEGLAFHEVSERDKRHGQAVAAASLPPLR